MNKHNLKVGQTVFVIGTQRHSKSELRESQIIKVGKKYTSNATILMGLNKSKIVFVPWCIILLKSAT